MWWRLNEQDFFRYPIWIKNDWFFALHVRLKRLQKKRQISWVSEKMAFGIDLLVTNGDSYAWSCKQINKLLSQVHRLLKCFWSWKSLKYWNQVGGNWKSVSCHGNIIFYCSMCVVCRTISLPSFGGLYCKVTNIHKILCFECIP